MPIDHQAQDQTPTVSVSGTGPVLVTGAAGFIGMHVCTAFSSIAAVQSNGCKSAIVEKRNDERALCINVRFKVHLHLCYTIRCLICNCVLDRVGAWLLACCAFIQINTLQRGR